MAEKPPSDKTKTGTDKSKTPKTRRPRQRPQTGSSAASDRPAYSTLSGAAQCPETGRGAESREQKIRHRAYELWEQDGCPSGRADDYWHRAERELAAEAANRS